MFLILYKTNDYRVFPVHNINILNKLYLYITLFKCIVYTDIIIDRVSTYIMRRILKLLMENFSNAITITLRVAEFYICQM